MLTKIAFKNVGKSFRDYAVYFCTLVFGVCVFYMFNSIYAQKDIMVVTEATDQSMKALSEMLNYVSVFVSVVLGFLIVYANNFFIKRRKKELGIYMTLGMNKNKISSILVLETSLIAVVSLAVGLLLGILGSQFMSVFTAKIFEADMSEFKFIFSPDATLKSVLYFGLIYAIVIVFNTIAISKFKLIDLLYGGRKNENFKVKRVGVSIFFMVLAITFLVAAYYLILTNGMINMNLKFLMSIIFGIIGTVLFFFSIAGILSKFVQSNKKVYFNNLNIFILRQLNSKINTNFISMSVVCIVLLLTIGIFSTGYSMQNVLSSELRESVAYDVNYIKWPEDGEKVESIYNKLPDNLKNSKHMRSYEEHFIYSQEGITIGSMGIDLRKEEEMFMKLTPDFINLSDYNELLKMNGKQPITLNDDKYIVNSSNKNIDGIAEKIVANNVDITLNEKKLTPIKTISDLNTSNNVYSLFIVVNDKYTQNMNASQVVLNIMCKDNEATNSYCQEIKDFEKIKEQNSAYSYTITRPEMYEQSVSAKAVISFLAIYLGIVFMITCAAILAIQQLSEAADNKERYELLRKLGADKNMLNKALFKQILCYFLFPLILAVVHSVIGLKAANEVISMMGQMDVVGSMSATAIFVVFIYGLYFALTYIGSKNIINKE